MTVAKNVAFRPGDPQRRKDEISTASRSCSARAPLAVRRPAALTALGRPAPAHGARRALAVEPAVLLLDEPFGALDAKVRKELRDWLRRLHDEVHVTTVFVTHDRRRPSRSPTRSS